MEVGAYTADRLIADTVVAIGLNPAIPFTHVTVDDFKGGYVQVNIELLTEEVLHFARCFVKLFNTLMSYRTRGHPRFLVCRVLVQYVSSSDFGHFCVWTTIIIDSKCCLCMDRHLLVWTKVIFNTSPNSALVLSP